MERRAQYDRHLQEREAWSNYEPSVPDPWSAYHFHPADAFAPMDAFDMFRDFFFGAHHPFAAPLSSAGWMDPFAGLLGDLHAGPFGGGGNLMPGFASLGPAPGMGSRSTVSSTRGSLRETVTRHSTADGGCGAGCELSRRPGLRRLRSPRFPCLPLAQAWCGRSA